MPPKVPDNVDEAVEQLKAFDPSYAEQNEETAKTSINNLIAAASDPEKQENIGESASENLADPSTKDKIKQLIIQLAKDQSTIEALFQEIADILRKIDELQVSDKLLPDWISIRDTYRQLVKQSKEQASNLSSFAKSFATVLLPSIIDNKDDPDTVKSILDVYIEVCVNLLP
jgi:predicted O-linked N-acetylglucosamine transferase (SPINDLY family)